MFAQGFKRVAAGEQKLFTLPQDTGGQCVGTAVSAADRLVGLVVKASASGAEDPRFESRLRRDFSGVESYQRLQNWHSSGYPARHLAL